MTSMELVYISRHRVAPLTEPRKDLQKLREEVRRAWAIHFLSHVVPNHAICPASVHRALATSANEHQGPGAAAFRCPWLVVVSAPFAGLAAGSGGALGAKGGAFSIRGGQPGQVDICARRGRLTRSVR